MRGHESNHLHLFQLLTFQKQEYGKTTGNTTARQYPQNFADEIQLNEEFGVFVSNYCLAYQGPNTALAQIGSKLDGEGMKIYNGVGFFISNMPECMFIHRRGTVNFSALFNLKCKLELETKKCVRRFNVD